MLKSDLHGIVSESAENKFVSNIHGHIRVVDNFKPGVSFKDLTTVWNDPQAYLDSINAISLLVRNDVVIHKVAAIEARGWVYGATLALRMNRGYVPIRKHGKLPAATIEKTYGLEYAEDTVEIHQDAITPGENILLVDDLIATGGSTLAAIDLINTLGGNVIQVVALLSLEGLGGREKLIKSGYDARAVIHYPDK